MTPEEMQELRRLYRKTNGGLTRLTDADFERYAALRKQEYLERKAELLASGKATRVWAQKSDDGDIIGWNKEKDG